MTTDLHPAWLPDAALAPIGSARVAVLTTGPLAATIRAEVERAIALHGGSLVTEQPDLVLADTEAVAANEAHRAALEAGPIADDGYVIARRDGGTAVVGAGERGLLTGLFALLRTSADAELVREAPVRATRMLDHWDNIGTHPVMGTVERGYAGDSLFFDEHGVRPDLSRINDYARLLASVGISAIAINNVNVHAREARLLTDDLGDVARVADVLRPWGIRLHLSVSFAAPILLGGLSTSDPLDADVQAWWRTATETVYAAIPDFGGYLVKADSEGQPGPFAYGRDHADGANLLAAALEPHGGVVHWRAFVYNHHQDWRDRGTDRARAAYDHFAPLDGRFAANVVLQAKHGPMDFQVREPVSPVLAAMPATRVALELQVTQEYTGHQKHVCYLEPMWRGVLDFAFPQGSTAELVDDVVAVANVGTDRYWTGHPLAQANLYAFARLAWGATGDLLEEWLALTFAGVEAEAVDVVRDLMADSWRTYERYTAPLGVGFMVSPLRGHYGPDIDGYEYSRWGTYHFADRDGIGVDRTVATGTGYAGQYPEPWRSTYEQLETCPDELLLFFHHVPYGHRLHSGSSVIEHIYDTHVEGAAETERMQAAWQGVHGSVDDALHERIAERLVEQVRSAAEWRDQIGAYFQRKSGVRDERLPA